MEQLYKTDRLVIRRWRDADAADLFEYCGNAEVTKYLPFPTYTSVADSYTRFADMRGRYAKYDGGDRNANVDFAIELGGKVIGSVGFVGYRESAGGVVEIGYLLNPKYQGKGYMTEVVLGMFRYIKQNKLAMRIEAKHDVENPASGCVMQKAGMKFEGVGRKAFDNNNGKRRDVACYAILIEEIK